MYIVYDTRRFPLWAVFYSIYGFDGCSDGVLVEEYEKFDKWFARFQTRYDYLHIEFPEDIDEERWFEDRPEFGEPCDCVFARIWGCDK